MRSTENHTNLTIFFATDLHASDVCFRKFLAAATVYKADVLVLGGDLCGKAVVPVVQQDTSGYLVRWKGRELMLTEESLDPIEGEIRSQGFYPVRMSQGDLQRLESGDQIFLQTAFRRAISESLRHWVELAHKRLTGTHVKCYISPGNDDPEYVESLLSPGQLLLNRNEITNPDDRVVDLGAGFQMLTLGYSNRTPFNTPRELEESALKERIWHLASEVKDFRRAIFNIHVPPVGSGLDWAPAIGNDHSVQLRGGQPEFVPVGSTAVREAILHFHPIVSLHGHVHESRGHAVLDNTLALNPGSQYNEGILNGALIKLGQAGVLNYQLVSG